MQVKIAPPPDKSSSVLIIGAGTWGTAVAYQLASRGYTSVKVLDSNEFPSAIAAGNDSNKILEEAMSQPSPLLDDVSYTWATIYDIATQIWKTDPVYSPHYHSTGFIYSAVGDAAYDKVLEACEDKPDIYEPLKDAEAFRRTMPKGVLTGYFEGWRGFFRKERAGWVEARDAMKDVHSAATRLGVTFVCNAEKGKVSELLYSSSGDDIVGAITADGTEHQAHTTILSAGASSSLLLEFEDQLRPTAWTLAHVPLSKTEAESGAYNELPVLYGVDQGFFISPPVSSLEAGTPELKICDEHPGYINLVPGGPDGKLRPLPLQRNAIPLPSAIHMRELLRATAPQLADRPLLRPRLCWDSDTPDRLFLISRHPRYPSLLIAAGASGHGFMCSPAVGVLVADLLEGNIEERVSKSLRWRPKTAKGRNWFDTQGRFGGAGRIVDLSEIGDDEWFEDTPLSDTHS